MTSAQKNMSDICLNNFVWSTVQYLECWKVTENIIKLSWKELIALYMYSSCFVYLSVNGANFHRRKRQKVGSTTIVRNFVETGWMSDGC